MKFNHLFYAFINFLILLLLTGCGVKKFPSIPFFSSPEEIKKVDYKVDKGDLILSWKKLSDTDISSYNIYLSKAPVGVEYCLKCDKNFELVQKVNAKEFQTPYISIAVENLKNKFNYCCAIKVEDKDGDESDFSEKTCLNWYLINNPFKNLMILPQDKALKITWEFNKNKDVDFMGVNIYTKKGDEYTLIGSEQNQNFYTVQNLKNRQVYVFFVAPVYRYINTEIEGKPVMLKGVPEDLTPPALPQFFSGFFTNGGIYLKWSRSVSADIFGYDIQRKAEGEEHFKQINESIIKKEYFFDATVQPGKVYYYRIRCIDKNFNPSEFSKPIKVIAE